MSARNTPPDELSSFEEEKLLRNGNSPNDVSLSHLRRIRYSQFNSKRHFQYNMSTIAVYNDEASTSSTDSSASGDFPESCKSKYFDQALPNWLYPSSVGLSEAVLPKVELDLDPLGNRCFYVVSFHFIGCAAIVALPPLIPGVPCTQLYEPLIFGVDKDLGVDFGLMNSGIKYEL
ncbi:hypothetical protein T12_5629 [Trichinella patagoniensis]|uniref:Uncharacterized protein n=1 Tax=Trichinella patagoniensis TaxID=990121 RepID=A0A0V0Z8X9_9BILA|nr:hypothetical protein T12_5629 [Trichinella patagoniensis]